MTLTEQEEKEIKDAATEWVGSNEDEEGQDTWSVLRMAYIAGATAATLRERNRLREAVKERASKIHDKEIGKPVKDAYFESSEMACEWFLSLLSGDTTTEKP